MYNECLCSKVSVQKFSEYTQNYFSTYQDIDRKKNKVRHTQIRIQNGTRRSSGSTNGLALHKIDTCKWMKFRRHSLVSLACRIGTNETSKQEKEKPESEFSKERNEIATGYETERETFHNGKAHLQDMNTTNIVVYEARKKLDMKFKVCILIDKKN